MIPLVSNDISDELQLSPEEWGRKKSVVESINLLLSHHPPSQYGHCLRITIKGHSLYFCARCSGIYGGLILSIPIFLLLDSITPFRLFQPSWLWFLVALPLGFATIIDWVTQRVTPRKTTVRIRAITGLASGIGLAIVFMLSDLFYMLITLMIMVVSIGGVGFFEGRNRQRMKREDMSDQEQSPRDADQFGE